ncbi:MAG: hypothetical protein Q7R70_02965 [Candidatus Diapherotrites archaeon]|nr:hypothetical protein [Candidatus Diapherotrites archaeon]
MQKKTIAMLCAFALLCFFAAVTVVGETGLIVIGQGFDNESPIVTITAPTAGQTFATGTTSVLLSYSAEDVGGGVIANYWVSSNGTTWINKNLETTHTFTGLSAGSHVFYAIATDDSDNNSATASVSFTISSSTEQPQTCSAKGGRICSGSQNCSVSVVAATDTDNCCLGTCVEKTCPQLGGVQCDINANDCSSWINQSSGCCTAGACAPKALSTVLCSFPEYLTNEPITAIFIEPSNLEASYDFNVVGKELEIRPSLANELADTIVTQYPALATYLIATNLTESPSMTSGQVYFLELLRKKLNYGTSGYSAKPEEFQNIYDLISASRIRWWNAKTDDTCGIKLDTKDYSLQTMHYFRINNLWLLWNDLAKRK